MAVGQYFDFAAKGNRVWSITNILLGFSVAICQVVLFPHMGRKPLEAEAAIWSFKAAYDSEPLNAPLTGQLILFTP